MRGCKCSLTTDPMLYANPLVYPTISYLKAPELAHSVPRAPRSNKPWPQHYIEHLLPLSCWDL